MSNNPKASELLLQSAEPFDRACMIVREMETENALLHELLAKIVMGGAGRQVLNNLADGIGTDTDEGRAWLEAKKIVLQSNKGSLGW